MFNYLFSFDGRINRAKMWLFYLIVFAWEIVGALILSTIANVGGLSLLSEDTPPLFSSESLHTLVQNTADLVFLTVMVLLIATYFYAFAAVTVKRLHDRNKNATWLLVFYILPLALVFGSVAIAQKLATKMPDHAPGMNLVLVPLGLVMAVISIWAFVELYCLRGTRGDNRFGADPLADKL